MTKLTAQSQTLAKAPERERRVPLAADARTPRARHPALWFVGLYGGGVLVTAAVAMVFHFLVFSAS